jgi:ABC-2 type transport system ATP-binding protein
MMPFLEAKNIHKSFTGHTALNDVSISVPKGRVFGLLGPNGAGKTTLIRIINRITMPDQGEVIFDGHPLSAKDVMQIGYLPEERGLYKKMKVGEQAIYLARLKGLSYTEAVQRLQYWFNKFEIMPWWNKKLEELSKGMQQKVQFIITVLHEPPLLIFDEPFSGFDPVNAELLKREILALRDKGHTIIFSTHNMSSVEEVCDEIALINHSQVILQGHVDDVKQRFSEGLYLVEGHSEHPLQSTADYEVTSHVHTARKDTYEVRAKEGVTSSQLISVLSQKMEIQHFSVKLPTMQEIFLKVVGQN